MSGPPRPRCRRCELPRGKSDCSKCMGISRELYGEDYHEDYFSTGVDTDPYSSVRPAGRLMESDQGEGVPK